ncbi:carnitine O-palmitoyltransferase 2, mitochondrial-like [Ornithodoros turicata]|uniref:carnitine O-palmitoyltransferase 2, mitochondrial-like n=1 Tax=Ornithodoros turicata TaxID=34597 RepID=UPI0031395F72
MAACRLVQRSRGTLNNHRPFGQFERLCSTKTYDVSSADYQYLQRSIVPTMHFQKSLPRLPIPELEKTCQRYLAALQPILNADEYERSQKVVDKFRKGEALELNKMLIAKDKANTHTSYISGPWFDMYLKSRVPLPLNYNPFMALKDDPRSGYNDQLIRATNLVVSSLRFMRSLKAGVLEPVVYHLDPKKSDTKAYRRMMRLLPQKVSWYGSYLYKAFPLDMSQFQNLFCSTRIPNPGRDQLFCDPDAKHLVVLYRGHVYTVQVLDNNGNVVSPDHVHSCLAYILSDKSPPPATPVPALTSENRDQWAKVRAELEAQGNADALRKIDSAIFALVLDEQSFKSDNLEDLAHNFLHGPVTNRWFDKSFSLIITKSGQAALNFEHSWGDGVAVLRYFNDLFSDSTQHSFVSPGEKPSGAIQASDFVQRIEFSTNPSIASSVEKALQNYQKATSPLRITPFLYPAVSRDFIKQKNLSPDSITQLVFQLAFFLQYGFTPATYEACSTSAFRHGRTETVRAATMATKRCVEAFCEPGKLSPSRARALIDECTKVHNQLTKEAAMGQGFDRHLFALRVMAEERGGQLPELYRDPGYVKANHFIVSTSTLYGTSFSGGGFAPVVPDGYGLSYGMPEGYFAVGISSYHPHRDGQGLRDCMKEALDRICSVLLAEGRQ